MLTNVEQPTISGATPISERINKILKKGNSYTYCDNKIKDLARTLIVNKVEQKFPLEDFKTIKTATLGGETLPFEKLLIGKGYSLNGVSYEKHKDSFPIAELNKPNGITIIKNTILKHTYNNEQVIWFDFMDSLRPNNVNDLLVWLGGNQLKNDCVFAVTYTLQSRVPNYGHRQLFGNDETRIDNFINEMANYICLYLENETVKVEPNFNVARYRNKNTSKDMIQYIFEVTKK